MLVSSDPSSPFFYFYLPFFKDMGIFIHFSPFLIEVLRVLNVGLSQLLPSSWGFIRVFEMVCKGMEISPTVGIFFSFYVTKPSKGGRVSLGGLSGRGPFKPHSNHYKELERQARPSEGARGLSRSVGD